MQAPTHSEAGLPELANLDGAPHRRVLRRVFRMLDAIYLAAQSNDSVITASD
jgi:hypothetical protein